MSKSQSCSIALLLVPLFLSACVPYVKYDDVVSKLERANRVNSDMEKRLKDSQLSGFQGDASLQRASARIQALESELQGVSDERDVLRSANDALQTSLEEIPKVFISTEQLAPQIRTNGKEQPSIIFYCTVDRALYPLQCNGIFCSDVSKLCIGSR